ncbi:ATP-binding cassette transporter [Mycena indigotica]|uniref:ATP-binding cassette transporter n=1 Tax=Mycena indigotica TaxID=2126181 RepID=A0A8H6SYD3_9AGAR|nr:ATP-binding cassette transporter [Mycena indigotica]KAF7306582.1 ATP-binding cassette transporter [Mycena indigotica]
MSLWSAAQAPFSISQATVEPIVALFSSPARSIWKDSLAIPAVVAAASTLILLLHLFLTSTWGRKLRGISQIPTEEVDAAQPVGVLAEFRHHVADHGGEVVFAFKLVRLTACLVLLGLSITTLALEAKAEQSVFGKWGKKHPKKTRPSDGLNTKEWLQIVTAMTFFYATALGVTTVIAKRRWSAVVVKHLNIVLLAALATYSYRDVFPLITYHHIPLDASEGWILWTKLGALVIAAVVVPLFIPRAYVPVDPKNPMPVPNPEQTASIFSLMFYFFLDPVVFLGYRLRHLSADQLPPLADYDYAANMRARNFPHLEVTPTNKRHLFFGLIWTFRIEYLCMALTIIVMSTMNFASPLGINRLLNYLENPDVEPTIKPWVWVLALLFGPMTGSTAFQWYIFLATRTLVRCEAIITQLVFEHALRIRVKAESSEKTPTSGTSTPARSETPSPVEEGSSGDETATETDALSRDETLQASSASVKSSSSAKKDKGKEAESDAESGKDNLVGKITNLVTTDLTNITESRDFLFITLLIPMEITLCVVFLYNVLGWSAFVGMAVMVLLFPVPGYVAQKIQYVQQQRLKKTDARVQVVTETMNVLRMIKLFGWERQMNERVAEKREEELGWIWKRQMLDLLNGTLNFFIPVVTMMATYATYTIIMKENLSASKVFSSLSVFDMLRNQLHFIFWALSQAVTGKVSLDRVDEFLRRTELLDRYTEPDPAAAELFVPADVEDSQKIGFRDATFAWTSEKIDGTLTPSRRRFLLRIDGELLFKPGCINLVVGPTGSGKTSLIMALLGEMHFIPSGPSSWYNLPRAKGVSYAAQESWVQNETIKENILFGAVYDEERYKKVIYQCALERDLELFDAGDATEVGEKGLTLSGGQKARVTLARAIYSNTEIILLDDVLAALDVHTSKWIVDKCFRGDLIKGRTIILVTHNVAMAKPIASYVVSMDVDGTIHSHGSITEALAHDEVLAEELSKDEKILDKKTNEVDAAAAPVEPKSDGKLIVAEEIEEGHVSMDSLKLYFEGMGGNHALLFFGVFLLGISATEISQAIQTWFLGYWARQYSIHDPADVDVFYYLGIFCLLLLAAMIIYAMSFVFYSLGVFRASKTIHRQLVESVLGTTLRWLDITPTSRVIARCTVDIRTVDGAISQGLWALLEMSVSMIVKFAAVMIFTPLFLIPGVLVGILGGWCGQIYIAAQLGVKREMSNAKAPVLGHFGASIAGLTSIRAYGAQGASISTSMSRIDSYTRTARTFYNLNRWVCVRIDALGGLFAAGLAYYLVYFKTFNPSNIGFTLNMAIGFSGMILWWVRVLNDFEIQGNSLERIRGYIDIEQEPKPTSAGTPPAYWPASGNLTAEGLSARYSADGPKVLQDISFEIKAGERVGIVGRTGSGKSSLTLALLRTIFTEGKVLYDGIPISSLNLDALRSNITIIPQIPELLTGSLRKNLDVFDQYDDATLNSALRAAGLFALQSEMDEGRITLDSEIASGGGNLSVGQRQILALARAIVRGSKLLILDEATSAIDYKTDAVIQSSLRNELPKDTTLLTVAHRLQTIMDADKIMVLDAGRIVEFDSPRELLKNKNGKLRALVDESGDKDALYKMAGAA